MPTAITAVENIIKGIENKYNLRQVNAGKLLS